MNDDSKSLFTSVTFWGVVVTLLSQIATRAGWHVPVDTTGLVNDLAGLAGVVISIYGRVRATQPVHIIPPASTS